MITSRDFEFEENFFEFSYNLEIKYSNSKANEVISIIRDKDDKYWHGEYTNIYGQKRDIPIDKNENKDIVIENTCRWYNDMRRN
ncbi:MAG: hypothetical protein IJH34_14380 [Romboutsia sp.]|nr:hypothetical protein [Romboutsia sp.]